MLNPYFLVFLTFALVVTALVAGLTGIGIGSGRKRRLAIDGGGDVTSSPQKIVIEHGHHAPPAPTVVEHTVTHDGPVVEETITRTNWRGVNNLFWGFLRLLTTLLVIGVIAIICYYVWQKIIGLPPIDTTVTPVDPSLPNTATNVVDNFLKQLTIVWNELTEPIRNNADKLITILIYVVVVVGLLRLASYFRFWGFLIAFIVLLLFLSLGTLGSWRSFLPWQSATSHDVDWSAIPKGVEPKIVTFKEGNWKADVVIPPYRCFLFYPGYDQVKTIGRYTNSAGHHFVVTPVRKVPLTLKVYTFHWPNGDRSQCPA